MLPWSISKVVDAEGRARGEGRNTRSKNGRGGIVAGSEVGEDGVLKVFWSNRASAALPHSGKLWMNGKMEPLRRREGVRQVPRDHAVEYSVHWAVRSNTLDGTSKGRGGGGVGSPCRNGGAGSMGGGAGGPSRYRVVVAARQSGSRHRAGQRATPPSQAHSASVARAAARYPFQGCYFGALTIGTLSGDPTRRPKPRRVPSDGSCQKVSRLPSSGIRIKDTEHRAPCDAVPCCDRVHSERSRILTKYRGSASLLLW